jgi:hypothetical protein
MNRSNPYFAPLGYKDLPTGLTVFGTYLCTTNPVPALVSTADPLTPGVGPLTTLLPQSVIDQINKFFYGGNAPANIAAPPCKEQAPLGALLGQTGKYPHLVEAPESP